MSLLSEFKQFIARGNVVSLAVAVVIGVAFGLVVTSFTNDVLMQIIAAIGARPDFGGLAFTIRGTPIRYGAFLNAVINFIIVAMAMFLVAKASNRLFRKEEPKAGPSERELLEQIRDALRERHA